MKNLNLLEDFESIIKPVETQGLISNPNETLQNNKNIRLVDTPFYPFLLKALDVDL